MANENDIGSLNSNLSQGPETDLNELKPGVENQSSVTNVSTGISTRAAEQVPSNEFMKVTQDELSQLIENSSAEQTLKGYDFSGLDFDGIEFDKKIRFLDCKFTNANFDSCDLSLVSFVNFATIKEFLFSL